MTKKTKLPAEQLSVENEEPKHGQQEIKVDTEEYWNKDNFGRDNDVDLSQAPEYEEPGKLFPEGFSHCFVTNCTKEYFKDDKKMEGPVRLYNFEWKDIKTKRVLFETIYVRKNDKTVNEMGVTRLAHIVKHLGIPIDRPGFNCDYTIGLIALLQVVHDKDNYLTVKMLISKGILHDGEINLNDKDDRKKIAMYIKDNNLEYVKKAVISNYFLSNVPLSEYEKLISKKSNEQYGEQDDEIINDDKPF